MKKILGLVVLVGMCASIIGCSDDDKTTCKEAIDNMYDEDCVITQGGDPVTESEAREGCEDTLEDAKDEGCKREYYDLLDCIADLNDCDDCDDEFDDFNECMF